MTNDLEAKRYCDGVRGMVAMTLKSLHNSDSPENVLSILAPYAVLSDTERLDFYKEGQSSAVHLVIFPVLGEYRGKSPTSEGVGAICGRISKSADDHLSYWKAKIIERPDCVYDATCEAVA